MRRIGARIGTALLDEFAERRVRYVRHYHPHVDLSWQTVFQTDNRDSLADVCSRMQIHHEWLDRGILRTTQTSQGVAVCPGTGDRVYFNQAQLFHVSSLGERAAKQVTQVFGKDRLPRHAQFGDGAEIDSADLERVRAAFAAEAVTFKWRPGDVVLLDNMQVAHGRRPFKGTRKVLAALLDHYAPAVNGNE
jgi:hypothetical protein